MSMGDRPKHDVCAECNSRVHGAVTPDGEWIKLDAVTKVYKVNPKDQKCVEVKSATGERMVLADHLPRCCELQRLHQQIARLKDQIERLKGGMVEDESVIPPEVFKTSTASEIEENPRAGNTPETDEFDWLED